MAWREALRDFYSRIAGRLQAAQDEAPGASWVAVRVAGQPCLLPLQQSGEIFPATPLQHLPYTRSWFLGVANLRGELFSVVDLAAYLMAVLQTGDSTRPWAGRASHPSSSPGLDPPAQSRFEAPTAEPGWFVTLHPCLEVRSALRVDALEGLRSSTDLGPALDPPACLEAMPALAPWVSAAHDDPAGTTWFVLDLHRIASEPGFLHVHA